MAQGRRLLFISNGHGEDAIAAEIIRRLPSGFSIDAYPTLGAGRSYDGVCTVVGPRANLPSEGWRNVRYSLLRDVFGGLATTLLPGLAFFRRARNAYDRIVVVGDMIGVYGCFLTGIRNILYLDVYKTGFGKTYLPFERSMLRQTASDVFCRAESLAGTLRAAGVNARCAGNVMMDTIPAAPYDAEGRRERATAVTVLPGSRAHALKNVAIQVAALRLLRADAMPDLFLPVASSLPVAELARAAGLDHQPGDGGTDLGRLLGKGLNIHLLAGSALGAALHASDLVLSQAGTATIQALGLGQPAVTFRSDSDRASRFEDEQRLFGDARQVVPADPAAIARRLGSLLADSGERERLGAVGRERIGGPGAIDAIIANL